MTTVTLELPDELAARLDSVGNQLPALLSNALDLAGLPRQIPVTPTQVTPVWNEVLDFLTKAPSTAEIVAFKISDKSQSRLETLLDNKREGELTLAEQAELQTYQQIHHLLILLKARAR